MRVLSPFSYVSHRGRVTPKDGRRDDSQKPDIGPDVTWTTLLNSPLLRPYTSQSRPPRLSPSRDPDPRSLLDPIPTLSPIPVWHLSTVRPRHSTRHDLHFTSIIDSHLCIGSRGWIEKLYDVWVCRGWTHRRSTFRSRRSTSQTSGWCHDPTC